MRLVLRLPRVTALFPSASGQAMVVSVLLHVGVLAGAVVAASLGEGVPERPRIYTVSLVSEDPGGGGSPAGPPPEPERKRPEPERKPPPEPEPPEPEPEPEPERRPAAVPEPREAVPVPVPAEKPRERRVPAQSREEPPAAPTSSPSASPEPASPAGDTVEAGDGQGVGLLTGPGMPGGVPTIDSEAFPFAYYRRILTAQLRASWNRPLVPGGLTRPIRMTVRFEILRGGAITGVETVSASGYAPLDRSALRAVYDANPLPPLPEEFVGNRLAVNFYFELTPES
jgi:TonB family protein